MKRTIVRAVPLKDFLDWHLFVTADMIKFFD